ncbi:hypothetical protein BHM03_00061679 [Ensete ventricosum]|nr:hypothetical protein BHM03_00061679 [Ensete ventricosum]
MRSRTSMLSRKNATVINITRSRAQSRVSIGFSCTISEIQNMANPNVLAHESSFDPFFVHRLGNSKYWSFPSYWPMGSRTSTQSRVSIGFSCTVSEIQNTGH